MPLRKPDAGHAEVSGVPLKDDGLVFGLAWASLRSPHKVKNIHYSQQVNRIYVSFYI
jgi:hypothetical protein